MNAYLIKAWLTARVTRSERGANLVEYMLLLGLIAIVVVLAVMFVGGVLETRYDDSGSVIDEAFE